MNVRSVARIAAAAFAIASSGAIAAIQFDDPQRYPAVTTFGAGPGGDSAATGDFNGDGHPDLAIADPFGRSLSVMLNQGDGSFGAPAHIALPLLPPAGTALSADSFAVAAADVDRDGHMDLLVASTLLLTGAGTPGGVTVLHGNGDGSFKVVQSYPSGISPQHIVVADFNGDGQPDFAVVGITGETWVFLGKGAGAFGPGSRVHNGSTLGITGIPLEGTALATGDFDGNGAADLAIGDGPGQRVFILLGKGDGSFAPETAFPLGGFPESLAAGDLNGDGYTDIVAAVVFNPQEAVAELQANPPVDLLGAFRHSAYGSKVSVLLADRKGGLQEQVSYFAGASQTAVSIGDFDGDGHADIASGAFRSNTLDILSGNGDGTFVPAASYPTEDGPQVIVVGDFYPGGHPDLAIPGGLRVSDVSLYRNSSTSDAHSRNGPRTGSPAGGGGAIDLLELVVLCAFAFAGRARIARLRRLARG